MPNDPASRSAQSGLFSFGPTSQSVKDYLSRESRRASLIAASSFKPTEANHPSRSKKRKRKNEAINEKNWKQLKRFRSDYRKGLFWTASISETCTTSNTSFASARANQKVTGIVHACEISRLKALDIDYTGAVIHHCDGNHESKTAPAILVFPDLKKENPLLSLLEAWFYGGKTKNNIIIHPVKDFPSLYAKTSRCNKEKHNMGRYTKTAQAKVCYWRKIVKVVLSNYQDSDNIDTSKIPETVKGIQDLKNLIKPTFYTKYGLRKTDGFTTIKNKLK